MQGPRCKPRVKKDAVALLQLLLDQIVIPNAGIVCRTRTQYEDFVQVDAVADIVRSQRRKSRRNAFTDVGQQFDGCRYETVYIAMNIHRA